MGFAQAGVTATDARGEVIPQLKFAELAVDAVAVAAGDEAEGVAASELREDAASSGKKLGAVMGIMLAPDFVSGVPLVAREIRGAIDVVPVGGIVFLEFGEAPGNLHGRKHGEVGGSVGGVGVEECAVPIEEDAAKGMRAVCWHYAIILAQTERGIATEAQSAQREESGWRTAPGRSARMASE